ncbi:3'-5' exoribonuclease, partial [bacterium]|nr:3'-5' exoribonuclease [bacterium]
MSAVRTFKNHIPMISPDTFVSIDVETTGLDSDLHEIIEIGAVRVSEGAVVAEFSELVKPEHPIPDFITHLTGISNDDVEHSLPVRDVIPGLLDFLKGYRLLGHNARFDVAFLRHAAGIGNIETAIDNIELARIVLPRLPSYSLDSLIDFFGLTPEKRHRALDDARITAIIFLKFIDMLRMIPDHLFNDLHKICSKTGSALGEVFDAQLRERLEGKRFPAKKAVDETRGKYGTDNNIFGDFSEDTGIEEPLKATIDPAEIEAILKTGGKLSMVHDSYEERTGQIMMAKRAARAFNDSEILLAEAGTGIGKSIAYLIPSIIWAERSRERVIISTNTKNLQEQLFSKDIPLLNTMLDFPFRAVILKGRGNYLCMNRWKSVVDSPEHFLTKQERDLVLPVAAWLQETKSGDLSETGFFTMLHDSGLLDHINSETSSCRGGRCVFREQCFITRIRRAAQRSHVIIVNHSLVFSDMVSDGGVLGTYSRIIFDEAHNIEKVALRFLGVTFNYYRVRRILNRLYSPQDGKYGILAVLREWVEEMIKAWPEYAANVQIFEDAVTAVEHVRSVTGEFFTCLDAAVRMEAAQDKNGHAGKLRYSGASPVFSQCADPAEAFSSGITELVKIIGSIILFISGVPSGRLNQKEDILIDLEEIQKNLVGLGGDFAFLLEAGGRNVFWFEYPENGTPYALGIHSAPLDVAEKLAVGLYDHMETVVMTSATLAVARDFSYIRDRLGLNLDDRERTTEFIADSPFDYTRQSALIVPSFLPSPKQEQFIEECNRLILLIASSVRRGMLVLFTSWGHLNRAYHDLREQFVRNGMTLLVQGIDGSRSLLLRRFSDEPT